MSTSNPSRWLHGLLINNGNNFTHYSYQRPRHYCLEKSLWVILTFHEVTILWKEKAIFEKETTCQFTLYKDISNSPLKRLFSVVQIDTHYFSMCGVFVYMEVVVIIFLIDASNSVQEELTSEVIFPKYLLINVGLLSTCFSL